MILINDLNQLYQCARRIQIAYRRYKFKKFQQKIHRRALQISASQDNLLFITSRSGTAHQAPNSLGLNRTQSEFFSTRNIDNQGAVTPTLSERKKSVSFCDPLEEVYYVESFKTSRPKSAEKQRRRFRFENLNYNSTVLNKSIVINSQPQSTILRFAYNAPLKKDDQAELTNKPSSSEIKGSALVNSHKNYFSGSSNIDCNIEQRKQSIKNYNESLIMSNLPTIQEVSMNNSKVIQNPTNNTGVSHLKKLQKKYNNISNNNNMPLQHQKPQIQQVNRLRSNEKKPSSPQPQGPKIQQNFQTPIKEQISTGQSRNTFLKAYKEKTVVEKLQNKISPRQNDQKKGSPRQSPEPLTVTPIKHLNFEAIKNKNVEVKETKASFLKKTHTKDLLKSKQQQENAIIKNSSKSKIGIEANHNTNTSQTINHSDIMDANFFKNYLESKSLFSNKLSQPSNSKINSNFAIDKEKINQIQEKHSKERIVQTARSRNGNLKQAQSLTNLYNSNMNSSIQEKDMKKLIRNGSDQKIKTVNQQQMFLPGLRPNSRNSLAGNEFGFKKVYQLQINKSQTRNSAFLSKQSISKTVLHQTDDNIFQTVE